MICLHKRNARVYFDPSKILDIVEPVDRFSGLRPAGWDEAYAAVIRVGLDGAVVSIALSPEEWEAVRAHLRLHDAVSVFPEIRFADAGSPPAG